MVESLHQVMAANPVVTYLAAVAVLLPWVLALVYQQAWSSLRKGVLAVAACFVASGGWLVVHEWATNRWIVYGVVLIGATQAMYYAFRPALREMEARWPRR